MITSAARVALVTLAVHVEHFLFSSDNPSRSEMIENAVRLMQAKRQCWQQARLLGP